MRRDGLYGLLMLSAGLSACGGEEDALVDVATSTSTLWRVSAGQTATTRTWDSGNTTSLSSWDSVDCVGNVGGDNQLVTSIRAYQEPSSNLDDFIAKLGQTCTLYGNTGTLYVSDPGTSQNVNIYTGPSFRTGVQTTSVPVGGANTVATGVRLIVNPNSYVKDVRIRYKVWNGTTFNTTTSVTNGAAIGYGGTDHDLDCPTGFVLTGLAVRHSTNSGKIRVFQILCRELDWL